MEKHLYLDCFYFNQAITLNPKERKICFLIQIKFILNELVVNALGTKFSYGEVFIYNALNNFQNQLRDNSDVINNYSSRIKNIITLNLKKN